MNNTRRKELAAIVTDFDGLREMIDNLRERIEALRDEEQEFFDNMPENFQSGDRGERAQAAIDAMENVISDMESIDVDGFVSGLEEAAE